MASIKGLLNPDTETSINEMDRMAVEQPIPEITTYDYISSSFKDSALGGTGASIGAYFFDKFQDRTQYSPQQLSQLYPDTPKDFWKSETSAFNAERIYDLYKRDQTRAEIYSSLTDISDANKGLLYDTIGLGSSIAGGLIDPFNWVAGLGSSRVVGALAPHISKTIPGVYKAIANSRFANKITEEIAENLLADTVVTSGLNEVLLNEFDQRDRSVKDVFIESLGTSVFIGGLRGALGRGAKNIVPPNNAGGFVDQVAETRYTTNGDRVNTVLNSPSVNNAVLNAAVKETAVNPQSVKSIYNSVAKQAFGYNGEIKFNLNAGTVFGVFDKETGMSDYFGDRYGDGFVFVDNPNVAQGVMEITGLENKARFDVVSIDIGSKKLADIDAIKANEYQDILDVFETELGANVFKKLDDNASLSDLFEAASKSKKADGVSGKDVLEVFNKANEVLKSSGFDGLMYKDRIEGNHLVYSVFDDKVTNGELLKAGDIQVTPKAPSAELGNARLEDAVRTLDGNEIAIADDLPNDPFYDNDYELTSDYRKVNDPKYLQDLNSQVENYKQVDPKEIELKIKEIEDTFKNAEFFQELSALELFKKVDISQDYKFEPLDLNNLEGKVFYHGSSTLSDLNKADIFGKSSVYNLYGEGMYLTDSPFVAMGYSKPKKTALSSILNITGKSQTSPQYVNMIELGKQNLLNYEEKFPDEIIPMLDNYIDGADINVKFDQPAKDVFRQYFNEISHQGVSEETAREALNGFNELLQRAGYTGIYHKGGDLVGKGPHNVVILFPDDMGKIPNLKSRTSLGDRFNADDNLNMGSVNLKLEEMVNEKLQLEVEKLRDYYTKNNPEQASEIAKAFDFCLRKNT